VYGAYFALDRINEKWYYFILTWNFSHRLAITQANQFEHIAVFCCPLTSEEGISLTSCNTNFIIVAQLTQFGCLALRTLHSAGQFLFTVLMEFILPGLLSLQQMEQTQFLIHILHLPRSIHNVAIQRSFCLKGTDHETFAIVHAPTRG
jgi:hypothetical protein